MKFVHYGKILVAILILMAVGFPRLALAQAATTRYVNVSNTTPAAPFTTWATAALTIQDAVDATAPGDEVVVMDGVYSSGGRAVNGTLVSRVAVDRPITLRSLNGPSVTIISGVRFPVASSVRCVYLTNGAALHGFSLQNGGTRNSGVWNYDRSGGGVLCESVSATVSNCIISGSRASINGGGVLYGTLIDCVINSNSAQSGGGTAYANLIRCSLNGNTATWGGGADHGTLNNCFLSGNSAAEPGGARTGEGGGAYYAHLTNCTVLNNSARVTGGGTVWGTAVNCLIVSNSAVQGGGSANGLIINCTIVGNSAPTDGLPGGGIGGGVLTSLVMNSIVLSNTSTFAPGHNHRDSFLDYSCSSPVPSGVGNFEAAPGFINHAAGNFRLLTNSPCLNLGSNGVVSTPVDLDERPRIADGTVDIGAYEGHGSIRYVSAASTNPVAPYSSWATAAVTIQDAVDAALAGEEIVVTNGVYQTGAREVYGMSNRVAVTKPVTVRSVNGPEVTSIVGAGPVGVNAIRCVYLTNGATLAGFTLTNGATPNSGNIFTNQSGGGVWCDGAGALLFNCLLTGNKAAAGGGVFGGTLSNCTLAGNFAWDDEGGGGAYGSTLDNCVLTNNLSYYDGGGATASTLNGCLLTKNSSWYESGGGAWHSVLTNCTLIGNDASYGGGAAASMLNNCLVVSNAATGDYARGGGVSGGTNNHCTITGNTAVRGGGAFDSTLNNCTITGNSAGDGGGGGAYASTLNDCTLTGNWTDPGTGGGAMASTLNNCALTNNQANGGGGAYGSTLNNCTLTENFATSAWSDSSHGGGALASVLISCTILSNAASGGSGGGIAGSTLVNCVIAGNTAAVGGGTSESRLTKCVIIGNRAFEFSGGGTYNSALNNCTVSGNSADNGGAALYSRFTNCVVAGNLTWEYGSAGAVLCVFFNSIVYDNTADGDVANYVESTFNYSCTTPLPGGVGNITNAPLFMDTNGWSNLRLQSNSPCINAGRNAYVTVTTDLDGLPRIAGGTVDMGAYEFQSPASTISYAWLQQFGLPMDGSADAVDTDQDGHNSWEEWLAGTNPTNALSVLRLAPPVLTSTNVILTWTSVTNRIYTLEQATNLSGVPAFSVLRSNLVGLSGTMSYADTNAPVSSSRFYQLRVSP